MDFGTEEDSRCGIYRLPTVGHFKRGELQEDILCQTCEGQWKFVDEDGFEGYRRVF